MFFRHRKRVHNIEHGPEFGEAELEARETAALFIQRVWRGKKERGKVRKLQSRKRPFGYYTHSLRLSYLSASPGGSQALAKPSRRSQLFMLMEDPSSSHLAQAISFVIISTIAMSVMGFVLETEPEVQAMFPKVLEMLEVFCTTVFTAEYILRMAVCDQGGQTVCRFLCTPMNLLDLLAILPFYVEFILKSAGFGNTAVLGAFRVVRLIRVVRVLKLGRYAAGMRLTARALAASSQALSVLFFLLAIGCVLFASALFYVEKMSCPERLDMTQGELDIYLLECAASVNKGISPRFGLCCTEYDAPIDFPSITATLWWAMVTMTSVGYGEVYPKTAAGKCVGFFVMIVGMVVIALPVAIVGQKFHEIYESHNTDMARAAASTRMRIPGRTWALTPGSDILSRMSQLRPKDPEMRAALSAVLTALPEVWEQRELLMRERTFVFDKQRDANRTLERLLRSMEVTNS